MQRVTKDRVVDTGESILFFLALAVLITTIGITFFAVG